MKKRNVIKTLMILAVVTIAAEAQSITERIIPANSRLRIDQIETSDQDTGLQIIRFAPLPLMLEESGKNKYGIQTAEIYFKVTSLNPNRIDNVLFDTICVRIRSNSIVPWSTLEITQINSGRKWAPGSDANPIDEYDESGTKLIGRRICRTDKRIIPDAGLRQFILNSDQIMVEFGPLQGILTDDNVERVRRFFLSTNY